MSEIDEVLQAKSAWMTAKSRALKSLGTDVLLKTLEEKETDLETALREEAVFKSENAGYLASSGSDCAEVKRMLAELSVQAPATVRQLEGATTPEKKTNQAERDAWLVRQRTENQELAGAIEKQTQVAFKLEDMRITSEMAKKRFEGVNRVLMLKTAQIEFLTER